MKGVGTAMSLIWEPFIIVWGPGLGGGRNVGTGDRCFCHRVMLTRVVTLLEMVYCGACGSVEWGSLSLLEEVNWHKLKRPGNRAGLG